MLNPPGLSGEPKEAGFTGKVLNNEVMFGIKDACERKERIYLDI